MYILYKTNKEKKEKNKNHLNKFCLRIYGITRVSQLNMIFLRKINYKSEQLMVIYIRK